MSGIMIQNKLYPLNSSEEEKGKEAEGKTKSANKTNGIKSNHSQNDQLEKADPESPKSRFRNKLVGKRTQLPKPGAAKVPRDQCPIPILLPRPPLARGTAGRAKGKITMAAGHGILRLLELSRHSSAADATVHLCVRMRAHACVKHLCTVLICS